MVAQPEPELHSFTKFNFGIGHRHLWIGLIQKYSVCAQEHRKDLDHFQEILCQVLSLDRFTVPYIIFIDFYAHNWPAF